MNEKHFDEATLYAAHKRSSGNQPQLSRDSIAGCFYCGAIFDPAKIQTWVLLFNPAEGIMNEPETALCPYCDIDSVISGSEGFPLTREFLKAMHEEFFC